VTHWYDLGSILVFVDRQEYADYVYGAIQRSGYQALSLHGGKVSQERLSGYFLTFELGSIGQT
jgi:superfamily II DNA/RNA helicase